MIPRTHFRLFAALVLCAPLACGDAGSTSGLSGTVSIDGSSTVFPIIEAVVEEFQIDHRGVRVTAGISGTGGGFDRLCAGEIDISAASRPIGDEERAACAEAGIEFFEIPVAWDGLTVVTHPTNDWVQCLTVEELRHIWEPGSDVTMWNDIRSDFPARAIILYGAGTSSGTFDYFTEAIMGESRASRPDYQASEDDNVLVQGVTGDPYALGYFGYAYYIENQARLKAVEIDAGGGCVGPNQETIETGSYIPLSRPLFIYVNLESAMKPAVAAFLEYTFTQGSELISPTGYVPLTPDQYAEERAELEATISSAR